MFTSANRQKEERHRDQTVKIFTRRVEAYLDKSPYIAESMVYGKDEEASEETLYMP
jgi:hypothetical protein